MRLYAYVMPLCVLLMLLQRVVVLLCCGLSFGIAIKIYIYLYAVFLVQDRQFTYNGTLRRDRATVVVVVEKQEVLHIVSLCLPLGIQHAIRMRHIVIYSLPCHTVFFYIIS